MGFALDMFGKDHFILFILSIIIACAFPDASTFGSEVDPGAEFAEILGKTSCNDYGEMGGTNHERNRSVAMSRSTIYRSMDHNMKR